MLRGVKGVQDELKGAVYLASVSQRIPGGLNERQVKMLNLLLEGFNGHLTTGKWAKIVRCSTDTALRDVKELVELGVLLRTGESKRSAHYELTDF